MNRKIFTAIVAALTFAGTAWANSTKTVSQVTTDVTLSDNVDYVITSSTPFTSTGSVNITNTDQAVVILQKVRPSQVANYLSFIKINGATARDKVNCMVKIYGAGSMIVPHRHDIHPLALYTGADQTGESSAAFTVGERTSLLGQGMNNRAQSFTLKRGYMVCMATMPDGTGYSRLFIADKEDRKVNLPDVLKGRVSFVRVMQWNDVNKRGYGGDDSNANAALNTTWYYNWNANKDGMQDREYVTIHHHEGWPSFDDVADRGDSPNALGNNEPDNSADEKEQYQTVDQVLKNWPRMMATGKRLGSPAMASDLNWLYAFIDSIDARGWRCDFVALHCYWYQDWSSWQSTLNTIHNRTGRPIWITEMNYGANWTGWPGSNTNASSANYAIEKQHFAPVIDGLESTGWIERYAVYNWVQDCRKVYNTSDASLKDKNYLTPMGEYYANKSSNIAFNSSYGVTPKNPRMYAPSELTAVYNRDSAAVTIRWTEHNGEFNTVHQLQRRRNQGAWTVIANVPLEDGESVYTYKDNDGLDGDQYRVYVVDLNKKGRYSNEEIAIHEKISTGDAVTTASGTRYLGGNIIANGDFDMGTTGWTNGEGNTIGQPDFEVVTVGGIDGGAYLQGWTNGGANSGGGLKKAFDVKAGKNYYFSVCGKNFGGEYQRISLSTDGSAETSVISKLTPSSEWRRYAATFSTGSYTKALVSFRWWGAMAECDKMLLAELFNTREEAIADGIAKVKAKAEVFKKFNQKYTAINTYLTSTLGAIADNSEESLALAEQAMADALKAIGTKASLDSLVAVAEDLAPYGMPGTEELLTAVGKAKSATPADYAEAVELLGTAISQCGVHDDATASVSQPAFAALGTWTVSGNYTGGEQALKTQMGKTCWNAWWGGVNASEGTGKSMSVSQRIGGLLPGLYSVECKALTQHYCLTDQHAFIANGAKQATSPALTLGRLDVPDIDEDHLWETLSTKTVYVGETDTITIGFTGTKKGAVDNAWRAYGNTSSAGDKREGWWCATDFKLNYTPIYYREGKAGSWGTICLPYDIVPGEGVKIYSIAGINPELTLLCLEEVSQTRAGEPYIYYSEKAKATFYEEGTYVRYVRTGSNNLRGTLWAREGAKLSTGNYELRDGEFHRVESNARPAQKNFSGYINRVDGMTVIDNWTGATLKINGADQETLGIDDANVTAGGETPSLYRADGVRLQRPQRGVVIANGKKRVVKK